MVKGSTIHLISKGQQDLYLTGDPKITFWKSVYRRHTQFAIETIRNNFNTKPAFGETIVSEIKRSGDLLSKMYLVLTLPTLVTDEIFKEDPNSAYHPNNATVLPGAMSYTKAAWTEHVGNALVEEVKLIINSTHNVDDLSYMLREPGNTGVRISINKDQKEMTFNLKNKRFVDKKIIENLKKLNIQAEIY